MGAGASADIAKKVEEASADDLKATVASLSAEDRTKLLAALGGKKQSVSLHSALLIERSRPNSSRRVAHRRRLSSSNRTR